MAKRRQVTPLPTLLSGYQWPIILATGADRAYVATGKTPARNRWQVARRWLLRNSRRMRTASLKGFILSELSLGIFLGIVPAYLWWLQDVRWLAGLSLVAGTGILMGLDAAILTLMLIGEVQAISAIPTHLPLAAALLLAPLVARVFWEWLLAVFGR